MNLESKGWKALWHNSTGTFSLRDSKPEEVAATAEIELGLGLHQGSRRTRGPCGFAGRTVFMGIMEIVFRIGAAKWTPRALLSSRLLR